MEDYIALSDEELEVKSEFRKFLDKNGRKIVLLGLTIPVLLLFSFAMISLTNKVNWLINVITFILVFYVGAMSLDFEVGSVGLPNFGKVAFFAIGAYSFALLFSLGNRNPELLSWLVGSEFNVLLVSFILGIIAAIVIAALFGFLIAIPTVKLRADYFAIMTIAGGEVIRLLLQNERRYLWQNRVGIPEQLISNDLKTILVETPPLDMRFILDLGSYTFGGFTLDLYLGTVFLWQIFMISVFILVAFIIYWFIQKLRRAPYGRTLRSIREDDITVTSVGKDVSKFRSQVTVISAVIASIAGIMFAMTFSAFEHGDFRPFLTFDLFVFIIIGGIGNSRGALVGTALITTYLNSALIVGSTQVDWLKNLMNIHVGPDTIISLPFIGDLTIVGDFFKLIQIDLLINPDNSRFLLLGIILILFLLFLPDGLVPEPKVDNNKYLALLTEEERRASDEVVEAGQSLTEKDRIIDEENSESEGKE